MAIALVAVGWRHVPESAREKLLGLIGVAARGDKAEIRHFIEDVALPKDPQARRAALARELEKNIAELKRRVEAGENWTVPDSVVPAGDEPDAKIRIASTRELIGAAGQIVKELESANQDSELGRKAAERILDAILPASRPPVCPVK